MKDWISVEDELPDHNGEDESCVICSDGHRVFEEFIELVPMGMRTGEITHWMPLPPPPGDD